MFFFKANKSGRLLLLNVYTINMYMEHHVVLVVIGDVN